MFFLKKKLNLLLGVRKLSCIQTVYFQIFKKEKKKKRIEVK
jgi:hypothetical protein